MATVTVFNGLGSHTMMSTFTVFPSIQASEVMLVDLTAQVAPGESKVFIVELPRNCEQCCVSVDYGDDTPVEIFG